MTKLTRTPVPNAVKTSNDDLTADYVIWQHLRPYIGHCLTLNHEVNNALTGLLGYLEFMLTERSSLTADQIDHLESMQTAALKIKSSVDRLSREKVMLAEKVDLRPVIEAYTKIAKRSK